MTRAHACVGLIAGLLITSSCQGIRRAVVKRLSDPERIYERPEGLVNATFHPIDASRGTLSVRLVELATGFREPLGIEFIPGEGARAVVLEKGGQAWVVDLETGERTPWFTVDVRTDGEQGLLGLAWSPEFRKRGTFYLNYVARKERDVTVIEEWSAPVGVSGAAKAVRTLLEVEQPYQNHNAGQLAFGPDGMLYVGLGDGGARFDPHQHGQNGQTLLGSLLRLDPDAPNLIPADNPFVEDADVRDEIYALGLRNPWRYSFTPSGQLVVADVGQDAWEEISLVQAGDNLGWRIREAGHCFRPKNDCPTEGLVDPIFEYGRDEGFSVTGGFVVTGRRAEALRGRYVFGDFVTGRMWALEVPDRARSVKALSLGQWPVLISAFGLDEAGDLYVVDYGRGSIYAVVGEGT
ncbi:MAG: PQQ-dependent sugar dehydrogenase [Myxococcota bacterium]